MTSKLLMPFFGFLRGGDLKSKRLERKRLTETSGRQQMSVPTAMAVNISLTFHGSRKADRASDISAGVAVSDGEKVSGEDEDEIRIIKRAMIMRKLRTAKHRSLNVRRIF